MRKSILIVDDNYLVLEALKEFLTLSGHFVEFAHDALSAIMILKERPFDVLITDYEMPDMNGLQLTKEVRASFPHIFIIGMSGKDVKNEFIGVGADAFFMKPLRYGNILAAISGSNCPKK